MPAGLVLVGLCGAAGAGKSTVAYHLEAAHQLHHVALADPIVNMLFTLLAEAGVGAEWITERALKEQPSSIGYSYRHLAQTLGTEWGRKGLDAGIWTRIAAHKIAQAAQLGHSVVVSDVRFPNEAAWLQALGGTLVRIERPHVPGVRLHESEAHAAALPATHTIYNSVSMATLHDQVDRLIGELHQQQRGA
jgi:hypothetical protein